MKKRKPLVTITIKDRTLSAKKRKKWEGIVGKEFLKALVRQDLKSIFKP